MTASSIFMTGSRVVFLTALAFTASALVVGCSDDDSGPSDGGAADASSTACASERGPTMARVDVANDSFCMDRTEVSRAQYDAFLAAGGRSAGGMPAQCEPEGPHAVDTACASSTDLCQGAACGEYPQTCVTVCDAAAFCSWAGKELCGEIGGGYAVRTGSQKIGGRWVAACGNGLAADGVSPNQRYAYGGEFEETACAGESGVIYPAGSRSACRASAEPSILDLSGNVAELNGVFTDQGSNAPFATLAFGTGRSDFRGACNAGVGVDIGTTQPDVGFRCCKSVSN